MTDLFNVITKHLRCYSNFRIRVQILLWPQRFVLALVGEQKLFRNL